MSKCIAIVGAGRMGSTVSRNLPGNTKKIIIDHNLDKARSLARDVNGEASNRFESAREADLVALLLPTAAINSAVKDLITIVKKGALILNMATTAHVDKDLLDVGGASIIDSKIIGHAASIARGEPGILIVGDTDQEKLNLIENQFSGFLKVVQGPAHMVAKINKIAVIEGINAAVAVRRHLSELNIPEEWMKAAIGTVCAGCIKSYVEGDLGEFALKLAQKAEEKFK